MRWRVGSQTVASLLSLRSLSHLLSGLWVSRKGCMLFSASKRDLAKGCPWERYAAE